jgi:homogentisate 1,2-dioxygenase
MARFNAVGTSTVDHADPSIFCALHSPSDTTMGANLDFMILPPRWVVAENTFRPPGYHRNSVAEILGVISGTHEARASSFPPGSLSLHNSWTPHGPDVATFEAAREMPLAPSKIEEAMIFMFETRFPLGVAAQAIEISNRQPDAHVGWAGFRRRYPKG